MNYDAARPVHIQVYIHQRGLYVFAGEGVVSSLRLHRAGYDRVTVETRLRGDDTSEGGGREQQRAHYV